MNLEMTKKIAIIGAGPGGLAAGMLLSQLGYEINIYEKNDRIGGRTALHKMGKYSFDIGPSALTMTHVLTSLFMDCKRDILDYVSLLPINPIHTLYFQEVTFPLYSDYSATKAVIKTYFPGEEEGFDRFMRENTKKMLYISPLNQFNYSSLFDFFRPTTLRAIPSLTLGRSLMDDLARYFNSKYLRLAFSLQMRYLGMSPWDIPAAYSIVPFSEFYYGTFHPIGGQNKIVEAMQQVVTENKGKFFFNSEVTDFELEGNEIKGARLASGQVIEADYYFTNLDFMYSLGNKPNNHLEKKEYSSSAFMLYLGLSTVLPLSHQSIVFPDNYREFSDNTIHKKILSKDLAIHITNPSATDNTMAPINHSSIRIMVSVPNNTSAIDWDKETKEFRQLILDTVKERLDFPDLDDYIEEEYIITPKDWEEKYHVKYGAVFGLQHLTRQHGFLHPSKKLPKYKNLFVIGAGALSGSSLPFIIENAQITTRKFLQKENPSNQ
ncbi:NAD(P)/FAD-dependent oxidoreductase [Listeria welshimeri]|uniref:phytoene desaturase family protein n=1 Tax=Listeria welshimeri TaxID=1643 RepID=UPI0016253557|nr:NAD(P)/FAD-dependent oxidoreductase [Listeria welshimeri]MBC1668666.1 NAD(P)/FAD-dependent oxidoreductase [Listeria welshimeri]MBC1684907.1 NAD(P)/FAD-dependent oxidoreductase [Listeria welshimeri]MBC2065179.1 NAD(P)/FAD-dependent oxidoreductase [Listeria welshimeri]MBF2367164.1 NAD(P)/FAD-dependent oxidoreductase [Listeria welshimeri]MBF2444659.1 NAD(P)/FAD-dependent oxidoreductase [Listeria welshimeri]